jgi:iron(III) transport system substrate-binding protein
MYRPVVDALEPRLSKELPDVDLHWYQAGSEKVAARLEAELAGGESPCDLLLTSDPFLYQRFKEERRWLAFASANGQRIPRRLVDLDGQFSAIRVSTMVLVHRRGTAAPPSFASLTSPEWRDRVALGDPLTSGTAFTWAVLMERRLGTTYFEALRANGARVAGGNAAVLQKVLGNEAQVGVLLLENALAAQAQGGAIEIAWPSDGAVLIPGYAGILASTKNPVAARAVVDELLSSESQALMGAPGDMHAVDPRLDGPRKSLSLDELLERAQPLDEATLQYGLSEGPRIKTAFSRAFSR